MGIRENIEDLYYQFIEPNKKAVVIGIGGVVVILIILIILLTISGPTTGTLIITVKEDSGAAVENADVKVSGLDEPFSEKTDAEGKVVIEDIPLGTEVGIEVKKLGYNKRLVSVTVDEEEKYQLITLESVLPPPSEVVIEFQGPDGRKLGGVMVEGEFGCSSGMELPQKDFSTTSGEVTITPPRGCGNLNLRAVATGFKSKNAIVINGYEVIQFSAEDLPRGGIVITVRDAETKTALNGIKVSIVDADGTLTGDIDYTNWGEASFSLVAGDYSAILEHEGSNYATETIDFEIEAGKVINRTAELTKTLKATLNFTVVDAASGEELEGAEVFLRKEDGTLVGAKTTDEDNPTVSFALKDSGVYYYQAKADNYPPCDEDSVDITDLPLDSKVDIEIEIEPCTTSTCGVVKIRVLDEDSLPVENARVLLFNPETVFWERTYGARFTDSNGWIVPDFYDVKEGSYFVLAQKYPASGESAVFNVDPTAVNDVTMAIEIGEGTVLIRAVDEDSQPVPFADVEIRTDSGRQVGVISLDGEGKGHLVTKADKRVYAIVTKEDYTTFTSVSEQIIKDKLIEINATLEREIIGEKPLIKFLGIFSKSTASSTANLSAGRSYIAKFNLIVPSETDYEELGAFIRVGENASLENDKIYIKEVNVPNTQHIRGKTFNPPLGPEAGEQLTNQDAKWVEIVWASEDIYPGIYAMEIELKIEKDTTQGVYLPLFYRAWAVDADGGYLRDPTDEGLGLARETAEKRGLYAESYEKPLFEGVEELCDADFCFGVRVIDVREGLYLNEPYRIRTFDDYNVVFSITNNSHTAHSNATIRIRNSSDATTVDDVLEIENYRFTNADAQIFESSTATFEIESPISLGDFRQNKTVSSEMAIEAKEERDSAIQLTIISDMEQAFDRSIWFSPYIGADLNLSVSPEVLPALIDFNLTVHTEYEGGDLEGVEIEDVLIIVTKISPDRSETVLSGYTDALGDILFTIPASLPGTKLRIKAEKPGFGVHEIEKAVGAEMVEFSPKEIDSTLNLTNRTSEEINLDIKNLIQPPLKIAGAKIGGNFKGLLDSDRMNSYLRQFVNEVRIKGGQIGTISVLTALSEDAQLLNEPIVLKGNLIIDFNNMEDTVTWVAELPVEITINLAELPSNAPCIIISIAKWEDSTLESRADLSFYIQNNCVTDEGAEMILEDLQAKLDWTGEDGIVGHIELTVTDPFTGISATEVLQEGLWSMLIQTLEPRVEYPAILTFIPKPDTLGKRAEFNADIDARLLTNRGKQFVGSSPDKISADILIVNLDQCIVFNPHPQEGIEIDRGDDETEFDVDVSECGPIDIDLRFCGGSSGDQCRGGTDEGGLYLRPWKVDNLNGETDSSRTITVKRQALPGFYGITVEARPEGGSWREIATMDVVVKPEEGLYFELDKYDFTIIGEEAIDSTILYNYRVQESVDVKAGACDWEDATEKEGFNGWQAGAIAVGAGAVMYAIATLIAPKVAFFAWCPPCAIAAVGVAIMIFLVSLLSTLLGEDPCDETATHPLNDYVINLTGTADQDYERCLPPDAVDIMVSARGIRGEWNKEVTDFYAGQGENGTQEVGIIFTNAGIEEQKPVYAIMTATATEHIHGDELHENANVRCEGSDFGNYWINPGTCEVAWDKEYSQSFHLRFKTAEVVEALPKIEFDTYACSSGTLIGRTGKGSLPRIKLNWSWKEPEGMAWNSCDADNPEFIYCDATQFTIELNKKLHRLYEFLLENNFDLGCPTPGCPCRGSEEWETMQIFNDENSTHDPVPGMMGLQKIETNPVGSDAIITAAVENKTTEAQDASVEIYLTGIGAETQTCVEDLTAIPADGTGSVSCTFSNLANAKYTTIAYIDSTTTDLVDSTEIEIIFTIGSPEEEEGTIPCNLKTTETLYGIPMINRFIEDNANVRWTTEVDGVETLNKLLKFNAYLIKDNYTEDFFGDFARHYTEVEFEDVDSYFHRLAVDGSGNYYGFNRLFEEGNFNLTRKYVQTNQLPSAGLYSVEFAIYFDEEDWRFFDQQGNPRMKAALVVYLIDEPYPNSPFYSMPFDGQVGLEQGSYDRQGYGVSYNNEDTSNLISIDNVPGFVKSYPDAGSNPVVSVNAKVETNLYELNTSPASRGAILRIEKPTAGRADLIFSPSHATPVMLKITQNALSEEKFSAFYSVLSGDTPLSTGSVLNYWDGAGSCLDFTGIPVTEAFYQKSDRAATDKDGLMNWQNIYARDWDKAVYTGDVYLRTIFYTNPREDVTIHATHPIGELYFLTPDQKGQAVALNGISSMPYNNFAAGAVGIIDTVEDVFEMARDGDICVANTGTKTKFWWNPRSIYKYEGAQRSIHSETQNLQAGVNCIGYSAG